MCRLVSTGAARTHAGNCRYHGSNEIKNRLPHSWGRRFCLRAFNGLNQLFYCCKGQLGGLFFPHVLQGGCQNGHGLKCRGGVVDGPAHAATLCPRNAARLTAHRAANSATRASDRNAMCLRFYQMATGRAGKYLRRQQGLQFFFGCELFWYALSATKDLTPYPYSLHLNARRATCGEFMCVVESMKNSCWKERQRG